MAASEGLKSSMPSWKTAPTRLLATLGRYRLIPTDGALIE
jgi:hypothetical protein